MANYDIMGFVDYCKMCLSAKDGYIMCSIGQDPKKLSDWYYNQYKDNATQYAKALYWKEHATRVHDCQGMVDGYTTKMYGSTINVRARDNYATWCTTHKGEGNIPVEYRIPGACVFKHNGSYITHIGYLIEPVVEGNPAGDWYVIEAKGVLYGVVKTKYLSSTWNRWGLMEKYYDYTNAFSSLNSSYAAIVTEFGSRTLSKGMSGDDVKQLQSSLIALGYSCGKWGVDGDFGTATFNAVKAFQEDNGLEVDGVVGSITVAKINDLLPESGEEVVETVTAPASVYIKVTGNSVYIRTLPNTTGGKLGVAHKGDKLEYRNETSESGWFAVLYDDEEGWISGKYSEIEG